jgi:hypothetical protein
MGLHPVGALVVVKSAMKKTYTPVTTTSTASGAERQTHHFRNDVANGKKLATGETVAPLPTRTRK